MVKKDKRSEKRIDVDFDSMLYKQGTNLDLECHVQNISSNGIQFIINKTINEPEKALLSKLLYTGAYIIFEFVDNYMYGDIPKSEIICSKGQIQYVNNVEDKLYIGCFVNDNQYHDYANNRIIAHDMAIMQIKRKKNKD